ncbi:Thioredoxin-like fold protein [Rutstroemia sp. NJR-2017a BBW]|nr:Thioredoxin-like fold protein [Rutstroemia sp. NJR-2017a BBW]
MPPLKYLRISSRSLPKQPSTIIPLSQLPRRQFSSSPPQKASNRIYDPVRYPSLLSTYIALSTSSSQPLLTLWTTSYCSTCQQVSPLIQNIISSGTGETHGGVLFCEVEYDAPDIMNEGLGMRYMVTSVPSLVGFFRGEVMTGEVGGRLGSREIQRLGREGLEEWVVAAARKGEEWRGRGGGGGGGLFGGLFGR